MTTSLQRQVSAFVLLLCSCIVSLSSVSASLALRQIHVVSRHGSPTTVVDGEMNYPVQTLSAVGESQLFNLGKWIRNKFGEKSTEDDDLISPQMPSGLIDRYLPTRVRFESSALDTTIVAAQSLARGLFPTYEIGIPVFTQADRNDITIAAADQCPAFVHAIDTIYQQGNTDWNSMEQAYMDLLRDLAQIPVFSAYVTASNDDPSDRYVPLRNIWKIYDMVREAKLTCSEGYDTTDMEICQMLPFPNAADLVGDTQWEDLKTLARYTEVEAKYGTEEAAQLIAGNLLRQIAERMVDDEMSSPNDTSTKRVYLSSAEYPIMIALMVALQVEPDGEQLDEAFPGYGSALLFELYQDSDTSEHSVRVLYKAAGSPTPSVLRMGHLCFEKDLCSIMSFTTQVREVILGTDDWCRACGNDTSDLCLFYSRLSYVERLRDEKAYEETLLFNGTESENYPAQNIFSIIGENGCPDDESIRESIFVIFFGGLLLGIAIVCIIGLAIHCFCKRQQKRSSNVDVVNMTNGDKTSPSTPKTLCSATSPTGLQSIWRSCPRGISPPANDDLDAVVFSQDDEELDNSNRFCAPLSPQRKNSPPAINLPSKKAFPPLIV